MSSQPFFTLGRFALLSALLLLCAETRAWNAAGTAGALGVIKMLGAPAGVAALLGAMDLMYRSRSAVDLPQNLLALNRRAFLLLIGVMDLCLVAVILLGIPFL